MWLKTGRPEPGVGDAVSASDAVGVGEAVRVRDGVAKAVGGAAEAVTKGDPHASAARATLRAQSAHLVPAALLTPELRSDLGRSIETRTVPVSRGAASPPAPADAVS